MKSKPMALTSRDNALLGDIREYGLHSTKHLAAKHFPGVQHSTVLRRLRMLEAAGYMQRIPELEGSGNAWGLAKAGAKLFATARAKINFPRFIQEHDLKLTALRLRLESAGLARYWRAEHEIRAIVAARHGRQGMGEQNIPDGLMGIETNGFKEAVAIELELTSKNQLRYARIFQDYSQKENLWGFWYVVGKPTIGTQLKTAFDNVRYNREGPPYFFWSLLEEVMADPLSASAHGFEGIFRLSELWTSGAPLPAQPLGTQEQEADAPELYLSSENKT